MFTTATLLGCLRPALLWARARLAASSLLPLGALWRVVAVDGCRIPAPVPIPIPCRPRALATVMAAALATVVTLPNVSLAQRWGDFETVADGRLVDVQVQVEGLGTVPLYNAPGRFDRSYFQAFQGRNYSLVVRNNSNRRVGVLVAVDGLN